MGKPIHLLTERERLLLGRAQSKIYSEIEGGNDLSIHFYFPKDLAQGEKRPLILFFNGGAWDRGSVIQFAPHALHFVGTGAICGLVEYRNKGSHPELCPADAVNDAQEAVKFVQEHIDQLGADPDKLVLIGAGAGANIAGRAVMNLKGSAEIPSPNAVVMYCPIIDVEKGSFGWEQFSDLSEARKVSLSKGICSGLPPMLIIHGTADRLIPVETILEFSKRMIRKKNICELVQFEGRDQNFFNLNVDPASFEGVLATTANFLDEQGILKIDENDDSTQVISWRERDY